MRSRVLALLAAVLLAAVGGLTFHLVVDTRVLVAVLPVAVGVPALLVALIRGPGRRLKRGRLVVLPVPVLLWLVVGTPVALAVGEGPAPVREVWRAGLVEGWRTALTSPLPLPATPGIVFWLLGLVWWASYWSARAALAAATPLLAVLPPVMLLVGGVSLGASVPGDNVPAAAAFAALAVVMLAAWPRGRLGGRAPDRIAPSGRLRRVAAALPPCLVIGAGIGLAAGILGPRLPPAGTRPPFDPRSLVHPQRDIEQSVNPLAIATRWLAEPAAPLFEVDTVEPVNQRLAVLGGYDGQEWSSDAGYVPAGRRLPAPPEAAPVAARTIRQTVSVDDLPTVWLPAPDRPVAVEGARLRVDPRTALLAVPAGDQATGLRYTVTSRVPRITADLASTDVPASGPEFEPYRALPPGVPPSLLRDADEVTRAAASPYQQMVLLQQQLRGRLRYDVRAAPGRTLGHIRFFYEQSHQGTADQFATAFALMARSVGFPARVAVGFAPGREVAAGRYQVATTDVLVWPEVAFRGLGWVPFYPVPRPSEGSGAVQRSVGQPPDRAAVDDAVARSQPVRPPPVERPEPDRDDRAAVGRTDRSRVGWYVVGAAGLLIGYLLAGLAVRRGRSLRRRSGTPGQRVVGAWHEGVDALARLGDPGLEAMTTDETARWSRERLGPDAGAAMAHLGALTSVALFSMDPSSPNDAADAWRDSRRVVVVVDRSLGLGRRIGHLLRPPWTVRRTGRLVSR